MAVPLPPAVLERVGSLVEALRRHDWPVRWSDPNAAHITLHFIGEVPPERAELLRLALPGSVADQQVFNLRTAEPSVFPNLRRPRVLWLGLHGPTHRLETLHGAVTETLQELDFPPDPKAFHPHITLGRVRDAQNTPTRHLPEAIRQAFEEEAARNREPIGIPVDEIVLMCSILGRDGARHEPVVRCPLMKPRKSEPGS
ncbi:MAG: RNA 2',3'-cyclic phosphodiesterase [Thermomicrobiales bacterium]